MVDISEEEFDALVVEALDGLPPALGRAMRNVAVVVEDEPPDGQHLLGLYEGVPLTERGEWYTGVLPDKISIFRGPLVRMARTREDVVAEVRTTVVHEVGHHFGMDDDRLHELGWG
ncbi:putative Zn-dependent protease with MMP-like domain [Motilibacter peucedani]|uniref:Putative Zn-dependent protease with MMP-like domain n=1 Tax=Motilibacter peucedani TaxID=598650 RepID=A0A420XQP3_9ACTN|nr:metallopeptidase family protein [Motilibacter peucedani]RKS75613.1 putative Zn-dependent protease with MMP-like domain [Motilibacter peucedani]